MISQYLMREYYSHCKDKSIVPTEEQINQALLNHPEKIIIVKDKEIRGIGIFFTLTDETYKRIGLLDIKRIDVLQALALENGRNIHFVLIAANSLKTILIMKERVKNMKPRTISWWNPTFTKLHRYICHSYQQSLPQ